MAVSEFSEAGHCMPNLELKLLYDLIELGTDLSKATFKTVEKGVRIDFQWQYYGSAFPKARSLTIIHADITKPSGYPNSLRNQILGGLDIFYMKGAFLAPKYYSQFLPQLASTMNPGGWLMTADTTSTMEVINPEHCLEKNYMKFSLCRSEETRIIEELMTPSSHPLASIDTLKSIRKGRAAGTDLNYWTILNLRQKI